MDAAAELAEPRPCVARDQPPHTDARLLGVLMRTGPPSRLLLHPDHVHGGQAWGHPLTKWKVVPAAADIIEREKDYTAQFEIHNMDTGAMIEVSFTQKKGGEISDVIGALSATARILYDAATGKKGAVEKLN